MIKLWLDELCADDDDDDKDANNRQNMRDFTNEQKVHLWPACCLSAHIGSQILWWLDLLYRFFYH